MNQTAIDAPHAHCLSESLPFVQAMHGQTVVIGLPGEILSDEGMREYLTQDIALLSLLGVRPVVVHGMPDPQADPAASYSGMAALNTDIVRRLNRDGVRAVGLEGQDAHWATATRSGVEPQGLTQADMTLINLLQANQMVPVLMSCAPDADGDLRILRPERFAAQLALRLNAHSLMLVSGHDILHKAGLKKGIADRRVLSEWLAKHADQEAAREIRAAMDAVDRGVPTAHLVDASERGALMTELMTNEGTGTVLCRRSGTQVLADTARYFIEADSVIRPNFVAERKLVVRF